MREVPKQYDARSAEERWHRAWDAWAIHRYDPERPRSETFVVDTPPPTTSGELHIGHVFGYVQQDVMVRYQRMAGRNIAYPMGWDNNGLPTERRTQNVLGIRPNPSLPFDPEWQPRRDKSSKEKKRVEEVSRANFVAACMAITRDDQGAFEETFRKVALSVDWGLTYETIEPRSQQISQMSFLDLERKGYLYQAMAPTMWDADDQTAVSQAEMEDRECEGHFHDIRFDVEGGGELTISTTRPELLGACIAVVAHPDDERYQALFGKRAITPLYRAPVPILAAEHADPEKGTGILMVCTFGDLADVEFWKRSELPMRQLIGATGRILEVSYSKGPFESVAPDDAQRTHGEISGLTIARARTRMAELLAECGALIGEPRATSHAVKFYERGRRPLEFLPSRQWFVRLLDHKQALLEQGRKIQWDPPHMRSRYEHWVEGLNQDWNISRQRYAGVPIPVWYPVGESGEPDYDRPIWATDDALPVDPATDVPAGFEPQQRGVAGGFIGDPDVMDTWATSSLTPQILSGWKLDEARHAKLFPADLRPQGHDIIRTWAFYTIAKSWMHEGVTPWKHITLNGWILDPDRKKMSKSKGNVVTPSGLIDEHSSDAVRYWAGRARRGVDSALDPTVFKVGRRLAMKIFNASRFVVAQLDRAEIDFRAADLSAIREPLDLALIADLRGLIESSTSCFEGLDYAPVLRTTEQAFWAFCDDYLELVKVRSYADDDTPERRSALATLRQALRIFLRLFAPFLPHVTEEVWSWRFSEPDAAPSIHTARWPSVAELSAVPEPAHPDSLACAVEVLRKIRQAKTRAQRSLRTGVARLDIVGPAESRAALASILRDVLLAGVVDEGSCTTRDGVAAEGERFEVAVELSADAPTP
jgi:valyl-tRNA synthetase